MVIDAKRDIDIEIDKIDDKLEKNSMSSITTLTIFSAVILAFTGSITFSSGVFTEIRQTSPFRLVFIAALIGIKGKLNTNTKASRVDQISGSLDFSYCS